MYTLALAIFVGFVAAQVTNLVVTNFGFINRIPVLGNKDNLFILVTLLTVWLTDTSVLGAYGMGNGEEWVDVVGSSLAIVGLTGVVNAATEWLDKK
jgi:uncharacterized membrane protein